MSYIITSDYLLNKVVAPNLPLAPKDYDAQYIDQLNNVLRLYFNRLDSFNAQLMTSSGGAGIRLPYGAFHQDGTTTLTTGITNVSTTPIVVGSTDSFPASGYFLIDSEIIQYTAKTSTTFTGITRSVFGTSNASHTAGANISEVQGVASSTTAGTVLFNNTDLSNGVSASSDYSKIIFDNAGIYNLQLSVQLLNFTTSEDNVTIWLTKNGAAVSASSGVVEVSPKHGTAPGATIAAWNYLLDMNATDYVSLSWASTTGNSVIATYPAGTSPTRPSSPALIFTATFVSALGT